MVTAKMSAWREQRRAVREARDAELAQQDREAAERLANLRPTAGQDDLEKNYKRSQIRAAWAQVIGTVVSGSAVFVAIFVALQGQITINHNTQTALRQSADSQLSTAITALGSNESAERVAGLLLLARNASARFTLSAETHELPTDVYDDYTTALEIFSGYLSNHTQALLANTSTGRATAPFGPGYGMPPSHGIPLDVTYAANQIQFMLNKGMEKNVAALHADARPSIDLANDELFGQPWQGVNFGWVYAWMVRIDLRGADLVSSKWSKRSTLSYSHLQCADLQGAVFRGANLTYADIRGANVQGADFRGAHIKGAMVTHLYGNAKWPPRRNITALPVTKWNQNACLQDSKLWDKQPSAGKGK